MAPAGRSVACVLHLERQRLTKANHTERVGRKATGLHPALAGHGSRVAGRTQCLPMGCVSSMAIL